jgi:YaiO family outer membrane protein
MPDPLVRLPLWGALLLGLSPTAHAQDRSQLTVSGFHHRVSNGFGHWSGAAARLTLGGSRSAWYLDAKGQRAFGDDGVYAALTWVGDLSSRLFVSAGLGAGSGDFVFPDLRADAAIHLKLGPARRVIVFAGATLVNAKLGFEDQAVFGGVTWYASARAVLELGGRINWSDPGDVRSERVNASATLGRVGRRLFVLRGNGGREGYQLTGAGQILRRFDSYEAEAVWQEPLARRWSLVLGGVWYHNPFYDRRGASIGVAYGW